MKQNLCNKMIKESKLKSEKVEKENEQLKINSIVNKEYDLLLKEIKKAMDLNATGIRIDYDNYEKYYDVYFEKSDTIKVFKLLRKKFIKDGFSSYIKLDEFEFSLIVSWNRDKK